MRRRTDSGGVATEYALIVFWIGAVIVLAVATLGHTVVSFFEDGLDKFPP
jgi:Flp pilus assembly pilin Flp